MGSSMTVVSRGDGVELQPPRSFSVPEEQALSMIRSCARVLTEVTSIPDVVRVISQAEAIQLVTRKVQASDEVRRAALRLRVEAELQLGKISRAIPLAPRGPLGRRSPPREGESRGKNITLQHFGIQPARATLAERLDELPKPRVEQAIANTSRLSMRGVTDKLGLTHPSTASATRRESEEFRKLARDAIGLLVRCQTEGRAPIGEEVDPLRDAYGRVKWDHVTAEALRNG